MKSFTMIAGLCALLMAGCVSQPSATVEIKRYTQPETRPGVISELLPDGHTSGDPVPVGAITIVPVLNESAPEDTDYLTLYEALETEVCTVRESGQVQTNENGEEYVDSGDVNTLIVSNKGDRPIFLMLGDLVLGGKQDRIMAESVVIEPGTESAAVPVFCVERSRWNPESGNSDSLRGRFYIRDEAQQVDMSVKSAAIKANSQSEVWTAVGMNNERLSVQANTDSDSFRATFDNKETREEIERQLEIARHAYTPGTVGYAVLFEDEVMAMDIFDSRGLCGKLTDKLLRSYVITALSGGYANHGVHPLHERLNDRVTLRAEGVALSHLIERLSREWDVVIHVEDGDMDPAVTLNATDRPMTEILSDIAEQADAYVRIDNGNVRIHMPDERGLELSAPGQDSPTFTTTLGVGSPITLELRDERGNAPANQTAGIFFNEQDPNNPPVNHSQNITGRFQASDEHGGTGNDAGFYFEDVPNSGSIGGGLIARVETDADEGATGDPEVQPDAPGTTTQRKSEGGFVTYSSTDTKRSKTVHRSFIRR